MRQRRDPRVVRLAILFAASALLANALIGERGLTATIRARQDRVTLTRDIAGLRAENARLRARVQALTSDPSAIEAVARRDLGLLKRDEKVIVLAR